MLESNEGMRRREFVDLLLEAGVLGLRDHAHVDGFVASAGDVAIGDLSIDSLTLMEIGIALEERYEVALSPNSLVQKGTLGELWLSLKASP